jgi:release factor glutamine methyltransferase
MSALGSAVQKATLRLKQGRHAERARRDAETLLLHVVGKNRAWLMAHLDEEVREDDAARFALLIARRTLGEPIQYITGEQEFFGLPFGVTPDVLIPRPETEHLVERAVELASGLTGVRILDVGTGSGAIAVALAHELPQAQITALDISAAALGIARGNAERNGVAGRIDFKLSDLLGAVEGERFAMIVSNLPYVPEGDRGSLAVEVREHEPVLALFAGEDGLDVYRRLIPAAFAALEDGGFLLMEIGYGQSQAVSELLGDAGFEGIEFVPDLQGILRVACGRRVSAGRGSGHKRSSHKHH